MRPCRTYSEAFKRLVVEEYLRTHCTLRFLLNKHGIRYGGAIHKWMRQFGYQRDEPIGKLIFKQPILAVLAKQINPPQPEELLKKIAELERLLEDEKLRTEGLNRIIDKAEEALKIPIRKKHNTK